MVLLPPGTPVLDLSRPQGPALRWSIGRYNEDRAIYTQALFAGDLGDPGSRRTVHMGIDLGGPEGVAVHAPLDGEVLRAGINPADGDYGPTLVTAHVYEGRPVYVLFGHLSLASLARSPVGRRFVAGDVLGWLGGPHENGGWPPHVHVQLALEPPETHDLPGAVRLADRDEARRRWPDPRWLLGPIYGTLPTPTPTE